MKYVYSTISTVLMWIALTFAAIAAIAVVCMEVFEQTSAKIKKKVPK